MKKSLPQQALIEKWKSTKDNLQSHTDTITQHDGQDLLELARAIYSSFPKLDKPEDEDEDEVLVSRIIQHSKGLLSTTRDITPSEYVEYARRAASGFSAAGGSLSNTIGSVKPAVGADPAAPNTNLVSELNNIDFAKLIGGPMQAVVKAQADASISTVNFIKAVGFEHDPNTGEITDVTKVNFKYKHVTGEKNEDGTDKVEEKDISIPLLAMLTVPCLRIDTAEINFNVKLNSIETLNISDKFKTKAELDAGVAGLFGGGIYSANLKVTASYQRSSSTGVKVEKEYTMSVKVIATQDEMPAGLEKILNLLAA